ncbi:Elongation factor G 2 [Desulfovibrionales bacterium]
MSKKSSAKKYLEKIRNIGIIAHIDAGKTTIAERILYYAHKIRSMGEVHEGAATMDFLPEEQERGITITAACTTFAWDDKVVNLIDTPGHVDFIIEVERSLRVLDGAVGVFCAVGGVEPQSEMVWRQSERLGVPKLAFVNKLDRPGANFEDVLISMRDKLGARPLAMQLPVGQGQDFRGVIDLVTLERLEWDQTTQGERYVRTALTEAEAEIAIPWHERLIETVIENDDSLLECYLAGEKLITAALHVAIRKATIAGQLVPVFCGAALRNIGVQPVFDAACAYLPSPQDAVSILTQDRNCKNVMSLEPSPDIPLAALAFKVSIETDRRFVWIRIYAGHLVAGGLVYNVTRKVEERATRLFRLHAGHKECIAAASAGEIVVVAGLKHTRTGDTITTPGQYLLLERIADYRPVISIALEVQTVAEGDRLDEVLDKVMVEDPTLFLEHEEESSQRILSGMGELHLEVVLERLRREYRVNPRVGKPQVVHQETVGQVARGVGEFRRELGDIMHYGYVELEVSPLPRDSGRKLTMKFDHTKWPPVWVKAVTQSIENGLQNGTHGYPVQDVCVRVLKLWRKDDESSPVGYHMAAGLALRNALAVARPLLLEPIMFVEVTVSEDYIGDAVGLLNSNGAKVENIIDRSGQKVVQALAPMRRIFGFSTALRSATKGRGGLTLHFARFDVLE